MRGSMHLSVAWSRFASRSALAYRLINDPAFQKWCFFSGVSFLIVIGLTWFCREGCGLGDRTAFAFPLAVVFVLNFFVLRYTIYTNAAGTFLVQFIAYATSALVFRLSEYGVYLVLLEFLDWQYLVAAALVMPASFVVKFLWYRAIVFREPTE